MAHFDIPGVGPTKEKSLLDAGFATKDDLMEADFYEIVHLPNFGFKTAHRLFEYLGRDIDYPDMEEITETMSENVTIENKIIKPWRECKKADETPAQPDNFELERTTVWSFENRGSWASHTPKYRGNWPPRLVRNVIELYSKPGDTVLDPMVGGGTTPVECLLTNRNSISVDINKGALKITRDRLDLPNNMTKDLKPTAHKTYIGDARNLNLIADNSIDLIATHPPYVNIIKYAPSEDGDMSQISDYSLFFDEFDKAIAEMYRVLKPNGYCAILIGDTHNKSHFVPVSARMMIDFLKAGFLLKEDIIKKEWNCESDHKLGKYAGADFLLTMHEHLYIFRKPNNDTGKYINSSISLFQ